MAQSSISKDQAGRSGLEAAGRRWADQAEDLAGHQIVCPHCGHVFTVNEDEYQKLLAQVRSKEFERELHKSLEQEKARLESQHQLEMEKRLRSEQSEFEKRLGQKDKEVFNLQTQLSQAQDQQKIALAKVISDKDKELAALQSQLDKLGLQKDKENQEKVEAIRQRLEEAERKLEQRKHQEELDTVQWKERIDKLNDQLAQADEKQKIAVAGVTSDKDKELADLRAKLDKLGLEKDKEAQEKENELIRKLDQAHNDLAMEKQKREAELSKQHSQLVEQESSYEARLKAAQEQVEFYKDFKASQSTKAIGEDLEQYCYNEFNKIRATAFPGVYFEKDNQISQTGSKGDFIYRETDSEGKEILSIMFEMKNEMETTAQSQKHKNADFLKELDKDRREKKCEYAVLVSMLEPDNEFYNSGIADVSYLNASYQKMYAVRPQFFITIISLLRQAAYRSIELKRQLAGAQNQNIDITNFEEELDDFKEAFGKNYLSYKRNHDEAIKQIDNVINRLEAVKRALNTSENQLRLANNKLDKVEVKKLIRGNPTMRAKFEQARQRKDDDRRQLEPGGED